MSIVSVIANEPESTDKINCHCKFANTVIAYALTSVCLVHTPVSASPDNNSIQSSTTLTVKDRDNAILNTVASSETDTENFSDKGTPRKNSQSKPRIEKETAKRTQPRHKNMNKSSDQITCNPFSSLVSRSENAGATQEFESGYSLQREGKLTEAIKHYEAVIKELPKSFEASYNMGLCQRELGELQRSIRSFERTAKLHPFFKPVYKDLADLYSKTGQTSDAQSAMSMYHQL